MNRTICAVVVLAIAATVCVGAQTGTERTVEESYLQESLETMIIREQAFAESKDMKLVALQYIRQALEGGRSNEEIQKALEYLASESTYTVVRSGGLGRPTNDFPDVRREACLLLGQFPTVEVKQTLLRVVLADEEPMVIAAAIKSLGMIGMNDNDDVTQTIAFIVNRFDILFPDNALAFESLVALEAIADAHKGLSDPAAIRAIMRIAEGNYIKPVKDKARALLDKLRKYTAAAGGGK